ncbi:MAG: hypothetical protein E6J90_41060 [Deltaproteobacteria bacterium]|nr:MAG: hypothetical protein E6J90_41060 [Deltaproteobacteria bacterium]
MDASTTLEIIARHLALATRPLADATLDLESFQRFLYALGWEVNEVVTAAEALDGSGALAGIAALLDKIRSLVQAIRGLTAVPSGVEATAFLADIGERLFEVLLVDYLTEAFPFLAQLLEALHVIVATPQAPTATRPAFVETRFLFDEIPRVIADPGSIPARVYGFGTPDFDFALAAAHVQELLLGLDLMVGVGRPDPDAAAGFQAPRATVARTISTELVVHVAEVKIAGKNELVGLSLLELPAEGSALPGMILQPRVPPGIQTSVAIDDELRLDFRAGSDLARTFGVFVRPGEVGVRYPFAPGTTPPSEGFGAELSWLPADATLLLGTRGATRLEARGARTGITIDIAGTDVELGLHLEVQGAALVVAPGDADGLLSRLFGRSNLVVPLPLAVRWSSKTGLGFGGSAGFDATGSPALSLGPITIDRTRIALLAGVDAGARPALQALATLGLHASLGPVALAIDGVGYAVQFTAADGNAGRFAIDAGFQLPSGVGLSIDAAVAAGGGFLARRDHTYEGAVELSVCGVAVKAYGLIETRLPGGAKGYSALVVISAEFSPGLQIGYGFSVDGVGGLVGIHRTLSLASIQSAIWSHHVDGLLFPRDPVAAAPSLMTAIDSFFPAAEGRYVLGPLAKIGWGGGIVEALIGLFIELPEPVRPQLELHIDFDGGVDFGHKLAFFDATLHDSRIERYAIGGDLAFRYGWGDAPVFALAIGGFHPQYQPPASFPSLKRISLSISQPGVQLTAQAYLALTSNTLQLGAKLELTAGASELNVHGWLGFDALVQWDPFAFVLDLSAGVDLRVGSTTLASVHLDGHLSGTAPWHFSGDASISLLFFDISVHVDKQWGDAGAALPAADPTPAVVVALQAPSAWSSVLPATARPIVTAAPRPSDDRRLLLDPAGGLRIAQRVVPLGRTITRFGGARLARPLTLAIESLSVLGQSHGTPTTEEFALAQFDDMSDAEKLSLPSFTRLAAGIEIGAEAADVGHGSRPRAVVTSLAYDTTIIDSPTVQRPGHAYVPTTAIQTAMNARLAPFPAVVSPVALAAERYVVAGSGDLKARLDLASDGSKRGALLALEHHLAAHPEARGQLQVVLAQEAA